MRRFFTSVGEAFFIFLSLVAFFYIIDFFLGEHYPPLLFDINDIGKSYAFSLGWVASKMSHKEKK